MKKRLQMKSTRWAASGLGIVLCLVAVAPAHAQVLAIQPSATAPSTMAGNHTFAGPVGMDFVVNTAIQITSLGVFDAAQNGINAAGPLTVELWQRNTNNTPNLSDDTGLQIIASDTFSSSNAGTLNNKFRTKPLASPIMLQPGDYTISAYGFSAFNSFWNFGEPHDAAIGPPVSNESGGAIQFVGTSRYNTTGSGFPGTVDTGPATRYLAGNFVYTPPAFDALLSVRVNRATGAVTLTNGTAAPVNMLGYSITSAYGSVNSNNWLSIAANYDGNNGGSVDPDDNWTRLSASGSRTNLSEFEFDSGNGATLNSLQSVNLGSATWIATNVEDLVFKYILTNGTQVTGAVQYSGNGGIPYKRGDLNFDGSAYQLNDFTGVMLANLNSSQLPLSQAEAYRLGDLNGDRLINQLDFRIFKQGYLAGGGSLDVLNLAANVPEPNGLILTLAGVIAAMRVRLHRTWRYMAPILFVVAACVGLQASSANAQIIALQSPTPLVGNQGFGGELGMDFVVKDLPITVSSLGFFDSGQNGLSAGTIHVELWQRNNGGTPTDPADDTGGSILASTMFNVGDDGTLQGSSRFRSISPLLLNPGSYTIVAGGFSTTDPEANSGEPSFPPVGTPTINDLGGVIEFVGSGRFGTQFAAGTFPAGVDGGPANRYHAGTFVYSAAFTPLVLEVNRTTGVVTVLNEGPNTFNTDFYDLKSSLGSLKPATWNSLHDQSLAGWLEGGASNPKSLVETNLTTSISFGPASSRSLGQAYNSAVDAQDIVFTYTTTGGVSVNATVRYVGAPGGVPGDYNGNGTVDAADYTVWRDHLNQTFQLPNEVAGITPGTVTTQDYSEWKARFGNHAGSGASASAAVPEPSSPILLLACVVFAAATHGRIRGKQVVGVLLVAAWLGTYGQTANANVTNERDYRFGNDPLETAAAGQVLGSNNGGVTYDSSGPSGAFLDIAVTGNPKYASVTDRPGALAGALGANFDGNSDRLFAAISVNAPTTMWDSADFFPSLDYPLNYESLLSHGMQAWVKPNIAAQNTRQDIVFDTQQHGIFISATNQWSQRFGFGSLESVSNASVTFGQWTHVMHASGIADLSDGLSPYNSVLLVNGVAVSAIGGFYDVNDTSGLSFGSNVAGDANFYNGLLDDARVFLWGSNTGQTNGGVGPNGQNYGKLFLGTDNDWIARQLATMGVTSVADVNLDGTVNQTDVTMFVANWQFLQTINGVQVGDWISRQKGDLNYDGTVDLLDAFMLHQGLIAGTGSGLDFSLLHTNVPEPNTAWFAMAAAFIAASCRKLRCDRKVTNSSNTAPIQRQFQQSPGYCLEPCVATTRT